MDDTNGTTPEREASVRSGGPGRLVGIVLAVAALTTVGWWLRGEVAAFLGWVRGAGALGMAAYAAAYVVACVLVLPGLLLTLGAGFVYGVAVGVPLAWASATIGSTVAFLLGRTLARKWVVARVASRPRFAAIDRAVGREGRRIVFLTRLSPVFPFTLLNYAYGITSVRFGDYLVGAIGMLPATFLYVYLGSLASDVGTLGAAAAEGGATRLGLRLVGLVATIVVTLLVARIARRALDEETTAGRWPGAAPPGHGAPAPRLGHVVPDDAHDRALVAAVHPPGHVNPTPSGRYNLVVIGAGTAGLVTAAGAAGLGARVALVERHLLGGDCLNVGCVPSKALLASARAAAAARRAADFGVRIGDVAVDFPAVMERMRRLRAGIAPHDSVERFQRLGVDVFLGEGRFTSRTTVAVDGTTLRFGRAVIATGARPATPPIPGLAAAGYLTNETIFSLTALPPRLAVIGAGPIGCELSQAFRRFGSEVTLLNDVAHVLPREDDDAAAVVERALDADGVRVERRATITRVERRGAERLVHWERDGAAHAVAVEAILLAAGRVPNVEDLDLETAGIATTAAGVRVDDRLRTTNRRVFAAGDVAFPHKFTHAADALARIVVRNALFLGRRRASALTIPWCTYTSPEVAHVGLDAHEATARGLAVDTIGVPLTEVDRAVLDGETDGFLKVHVRAGSDHIVGATLVAAHAGDMIGEIAVAMAGGVGLGTIAETIHPYPTEAEIIKKAADAYNRARLTPRVRRLFERWLAWRR
jgi:pyruvate/2-oxoglutarate dehydrogenase complex dihydrolipoamide dehydrogenase (E3) component/uncharacterized membrane protein YdjX (TVP38/TMEM64 family)